MTIKVLIVDDSGFFRRRIADILNGDSQIEVIDTAENGLIAVEKTLKLKPDVVTMDIEMPVMDGITAVKRIMAVAPVPILMFSSLTTEGAKATFEALEAGAVDYLPKRFEDISSDHNLAKQMLRDKVREIGLHGRKALLKPSPLPNHVKVIEKKFSDASVRKIPEPLVKESSKSTHPQSLEKSTDGMKVVHSSWHGLNDISAVAIGTSTGGPVALQSVLTHLPEKFSKPILLVQHMPGAFTTAFAQRLNQISKIQVKEAADGDVLHPGIAYLAPGGKQMRIQKRGMETVIKIEESAPGMTYKPSVDVTFNSVAEVFGGRVLAIVLTGMGADGREGAKKLKSLGAQIWAQDQATCVVYGMPAAIAQAGIADNILSLQEIGEKLSQGNI
ncbi:MAG: chemotaxis response regulator protein-glutamate methylesterase [Gammaproteobacteria bacterium]|nr:chemotaxis response regulator protein-glutamate methylesterase [Gammaproteobacteria bacterium]